jgi:DNA helicase-4
VKSGKCAPEGIVILAFNTKAAEEIRERLKKSTGFDIRVKTFHSLGLDIISSVEGVKKSVSKYSDDDERKRFIKKTVMDLAAGNDKFFLNVSRYFSYFFAPYKEETQCSARGEYLDYLENQQLKSLKGEKVKSFQECVIANHLFMNGIEYEYERSYEIDTATSEKRQYKPDFYLNDYGIYIEHFGIDENGNTYDRLSGMRDRGYGAQERAPWSFLFMFPLSGMHL